MNPNHVDITSLRIFLSVVRHGTISGGAADVNLSIPAVSKRISDLESLAGTALVIRGARGVEVTQAGHALAQHAEEILASVDQLAGVMSDYSSGIAGHIKIAANPSATLQGLPQKIAQFVEAYPRVKIEVHEYLSAEVIDALRDRKADIGVFAGNINYDGISTSPFGSDKLALIMAPGHPLSRYSSIYLRDALDYDFVSQVDSATFNSVLLMTAKEEGRPVRLRHLMRGYDGVCSMVAAGLGLAVVPISAVQDYDRGFELHTALLKDSWACRPLLVGVRDSRTLPAVIRIMLDFL